MVTIATRAREKRAIAMPNQTTSGASLTGIVGGNKSYSYALLQSFILNKLLKLREGPGFVDISLLFSNFCMLSDVFEVFHNKDIIRCGALNYALADDMVCLANYPAFFARQLFQEPFSPLGAFGLERSPQIRKMPPYIHCLLTREPKTIGSSSDIIDAKVYPNRICSFRSRSWLGKNDVDVEPLLPLRLAINQGSRGRLLPLKKMSLIVTQDKGDFDSTPHRGKRHHLFNRDVAKNPLVIGNRGRLKLLDFAEFLLRRLCYPSSRSDGKISRQPISVSNLSVAKVLELNFIRGVALFRHLQHIITGVGKALKGSPKNFGLFHTGIQLARNCLNKLHSNMKYITYRKVCQQRREHQFLPSIKMRGFLGAIL